MRCAVYCRVSTKMQKTDIQKIDLIKYCEDNNLQYEIFEDFYTGTKDNRPELSRMLAAMSRGEFDTLIIWRIDRLARNVRNFLNLQYEMEKMRVKIISLRDAFDITTNNGRMMMQIQAVVSESEVMTLRMRVKAGMAAAKARGKKFGKPPAPIDMPYILKQQSAGVSVAEIAKSVGLSRSQLYRRLATIAA